jgi:TatD DNase family protein
MIDIHAHLNLKDFDEDREKVISRFFSDSGKALINVGFDLASSQQSVELAGKYKNIFASVGLHPHEFNSWEKFDFIKNLEELSKNEKIVAIGEVGLDYFSRTENPISDEQKESQKKGFIAQIELAEELKLPVIIHCREAYDDALEIIKKYSRSRFVFHGYGADVEFTEKSLKFSNVFFSFSGNITYPKPAAQAENFSKVIKMIPLDKLMLDSDCPFLAPQAKRGKRNEPLYVRYIAERIAEIKKVEAKEVKKATTKNAINFFGIE